MTIQSSNPPEFITLDQWKGQNNQAARGAIDDQELWWSENMFPIGPGNLRSLWGLGPSLYTVSGTTIVSMHPFTAANGGFYHICAFLANGSAVDIEIDKPGVVTLAPPGTFTNAGTNPDVLNVIQWSPTGIVLLNNTGGIWAWDGATLTSPGSPGPSWLTGGASTNMPSSQANAGRGAAFQGRMWISSGANITFSAPNNGIDFATADGAGTFGNQLPILQFAWFSLNESSGFLYLFGDSSIYAVNNVNTSGTPATTTFTNANVDPQSGHSIQRKAQAWGRAFIFFNPNGFYALYGGAVQLISERLQTIISSMPIVPPQPSGSTFIPTTAAATIFGRKCFIALVNATDVFGVIRNFMLIWDGQKWSVGSQEKTITLIVGSEQSSNLLVYGTDGTNVYQLFARPSSSLSKTLSTKQLRGRNPLTIKDWNRVFVEAADNSGSGVTLNGTFTCGGGGIPGGRETFTSTIGANAFSIIPAPISASGIWGELDLVSTSPDFTIQRINLAYHDRTLYGA